MDIIQILTQEFNLKRQQIEAFVELIDDGNTIPFIARYRKEATGELDDVTLRDVFDRLTYLRNLNDRREEVRRLIDEQGKMTDEINAALDKAEKLAEIEDIYRPYKPKRRTRAMIARERGLEPLAEILMAQELVDGDILEIASEYINVGDDVKEGLEVKTAEDALAGACDIIAEDVSDNAEFRKAIRDVTFRDGTLESKAAKEEDSVYRLYYEYSEPVCKVQPHRVLAINRGEKEEFLNVKIDPPIDKILAYLKRKILKELPKRPNEVDVLGKRSDNEASELFGRFVSENEQSAVCRDDVSRETFSITTSYVEAAVEDSYKRLIEPSIANEIRGELSVVAEEQAIKVFKENLKNLLMQPPIKGKVVLALDPGYRTGCKMAVVDETGKVLDSGVIYPTQSDARIAEAKKFVKRMVDKHGVTLIAIGNGTASKESEIFIAETIREFGFSDVKYAIVNEAGASIYSASKQGAEEFPDFDVTIRGAISIGRRLQDPLAELVKIDAQNVGVGQYQHDVNQKRLGEALGGVVEDCVNDVGVDLNTASYALMSYISGINLTVAKNIVAYREEVGAFKTRKELLKVAKLGAKAFLQCAGFMRISAGKNILDNTSVHPESYAAAEKLLEKLEYTMDDVNAGKLVLLKEKAERADMTKLAEEIEVGVPTLRDIVESLQKPGRDPRDDIEQPVLRDDVMDIKDLKPGMIMTGTVRNVIDFGAFVDVGVHQDGLVHISQLADKFVKHPMDVVAVGDIVKVKVLDVDVAKMRISLTMKDV
ncbi:MAG: RNA-binding transcriptional accessory protein [Oscillospiraceae bacterium]|nr:RNA-binding transcriptional accessory protein [Oscillospiraceae bacterium]